MTTFKTYAIAAMMTVFGATAAFANNHGNNKYNHNNNHGKAPVAVVNNHHDHHNRHNVCRCRECEAFRYRMEMERLHRESRGPVHGCNCPKCEDMRHHHPTPHKAPAPMHRHGAHH